MPAIDSDAIAQVEYEAAARTLFVRFTSGEWYAYLDVPPLTFQRLLAAESKGRFFQEDVRGRYDFVKLDRP
ncbi:KTSC domain-containing protein [Caulobacter sp. S45]|uniref:KTSC domain-containing protein n=1 Tax=Caulobacter sp. S45 TaxID=1641861 RepID=UPI001576DD00|nr:KTSC domain-containing protein [Caulobacter sp. S45]